MYGMIRTLPSKNVMSEDMRLREVDQHNWKETQSCLLRVETSISPQLDKLSLNGDS